MAETPRFYDADDPEWRDYEQPYSQGGYIPGGPTWTVIHPDECIITRDLICVRHNHTAQQP